MWGRVWPLWSESPWLEGWVMIPAPYRWKSEGRGEGRRVVGVWYSPNASSNYPVWLNPFWVLRSYCFRMHPPPLVAWNCDADGWCMWWFQTCMCFGGGSNPETRSNQIWDSRAIDTYTQCNPGAYNSTPARGLRSRASVLLFLGWTNEEIQRRERVTSDRVSRAACLGKCLWVSFVQDAMKGWTLSF